MSRRITNRDNLIYDIKQLKEKPNLTVKDIETITKIYIKLVNKSDDLGKDIFDNFYNVNFNREEIIKMWQTIFLFIYYVVYGRFKNLQLRLKPQIERLNTELIDTDIIITRRSYNFEHWINNMKRHFLKHNITNRLYTRIHRNSYNKKLLKELVKEVVKINPTKFIDFFIRQYRIPYP
jgi:hypothetical protein